MVYGDFENSFNALPGYMTALQFFKTSTIVELEHYSTTANFQVLILMF